MDALPPSTHVAEIAATVDDLQQGIARLPLAKAVNRIDDWRRQLLASERADLRAIADDLDALHQELTGEGLDGSTIGALLVRLGEGTIAAAEATDAGGARETADAMQHGLRRLGSLLRHTGRALAGNTDEAAAAQPAHPTAPFSSAPPN